MAIYAFFDPNAGQRLTATGYRYTINPFSECRGGLSIRIYRKDRFGNDELAFFACYGDKSLTVDGASPDGVNPDQGFDCINGGCVPKTSYNTPGLFASLAACQAGCAKNSTCMGECVSAEELAALQQAASTVRSRLCS